MKKPRVELVCDVTGKPGAETRIFAVNDNWYALDLSDEVLKRFDDLFTEFIEYARRLGRVGRTEPQQALTVEGARSVRRRRSRYGPNVDPKLVRPWWAENQELVKTKTGYDWRRGGIIPGPVNQVYLEHQAS